MKPNQQLIDRALKMRDDIFQLFEDAAHWNRINPDCEPINPDPDGKLGSILKNISQMLHRAGVY